MFPEGGSSLERYSAVLPCAEINSSFHRSHRPATFARWADAVPASFRFSAKLSKSVTHNQRLRDTSLLIDQFLAETAGLGTKLGALLVQLPPSLAFDAEVAEPFFAELRGRTVTRLACEPRHGSWLEPDADALLAAFGVARVAADPAKHPLFAQPGGCRSFVYYRLHGSPVPYRSSYEPERLQAYAAALQKEREAGKDVWCIFDNTASSAALGNALSIRDILSN